MQGLFPSPRVFYTLLFSPSKVISHCWSCDHFPKIQGFRFGWWQKWIPSFWVPIRFYHIFLCLPAVLLENPDNQFSNNVYFFLPALFYLESNTVALPFSLLHWILPWKHLLSLCSTEFWCLRSVIQYICTEPTNKDQALTKTTPQTLNSSADLPSCRRTGSCLHVQKAFLLSLQFQIWVEQHATTFGRHISPVCWGYD